ncbi:hypothetical protein [Aureimonas populi]|uniref:Uncharacterized protein n=1 Tax=Aureimonas populi TaxID=1701758 RepID=A0ABW5CLN7_9HYPH|nr:hypothetical protein [Aureimonas populi]
MQLRGQTQDTLWTLILTPSVWAGHFLFAYVAAAYACAPNTSIFQTIAGVRIAIALATVLSLAIVGWAGWRAAREWRINGGAFPHDGDSAGVRERFMEFSSLLLAALSFIAILFTAMPALMIMDCR